jgi:hypothetical protein
MSFERLPRQQRQAAAKAAAHAAERQYWKVIEREERLSKVIPNQIDYSVQRDQIDYSGSMFSRYDEDSTSESDEEFDNTEAIMQAELEHGISIGHIPRRGRMYLQPPRLKAVEVRNNDMSSRIANGVTTNSGRAGPIIAEPANATYASVIVEPTKKHGTIDKLPEEDQSSTASGEDLESIKKLSSDEEQSTVSGEDLESIKKLAAEGSEEEPSTKGSGEDLESITSEEQVDSIDMMDMTQSEQTQRRKGVFRCSRRPLQLRWCGAAAQWWGHGGQCTEALDLAKAYRKRCEEAEGKKMKARLADAEVLHNRQLAAEKAMKIAENPREVFYETTKGEIVFLTPLRS